MQTLNAVALATAMGGGFLLVAAGLGHVRHFGQLRATLVNQALLPYRWHRAVAYLLVIAEIVTGVAAVFAGLTSHGVSAVVFTVEGALYTALLGYAVALRTYRPMAPCGCFGDHGPASLMSVVRTGLFTAGAWGAVLAGLGAQAAVRPVPLLVTGGVGIAVLAYVGPAAARTADAEEATWTH